MRKAAEAKVDAIELSLVRYFLAFLKNDEASMEQETTQRKSKSQAQGWFEHQEALTSAYHGRLKAAARLSNSAVTLAQQAGLREHASQFAGARAVWCVLYGVGDEGRSSAAAAKPRRRLWSCSYVCVSARLIAGSPDSGGILKAVSGGHLSAIQLPACASSARGSQSEQPGKAIEKTEAAAPYELAVPGTCILGRGVVLRSSIRCSCAASLIRGLAAIGRQPLNFRKLWIIRGSCSATRSGPWTGFS